VLPETDKSFLVLFFKKELLSCFHAAGRNFASDNWPSDARI
jgi:hypothetical protein